LHRLSDARFCNGVAQHPADEIGGSHILVRVRSRLLAAARRKRFRVQVPQDPIQDGALTWSKSHIALDVTYRVAHLVL
jgi:hypothetical protein